MSQSLLGGLLSATINPLTGLPTSTVEYLVVAGGAGGQGARFGSVAYRGGGGGGAGGLLSSTGYTITPGTSITITVGAGGNGATASNDVGTIGANSVFGSITAIGGQAWGYTGTPGGSGAGGSQVSGVTETGGSGTSGQGFNGGNGSSDGYAGGGGGGAGSVGIVGVSGAYGGNGGTGICSNITGQRVFYAGGGGGNVYSGNAGLGGGGGGGNASNTTFGTAGTSNTGGGGGAGSNGGSNGGSGIVIIRYPANCAPPASFGGSNVPQVLYNNGYQIYIWTGNGTVTF